MRYRDALGLIEFDLALGWRLDLDASTLFQLQFSWWRGEAHRLGVQLMPTATATEDDDLQWFDSLSRKVEPELRPSTLHRYHGCVLAIGRRTLTCSTEQKSVFVRGFRHDIALHEVEAGSQASSAPDRGAVLDEIMRGLLVTMQRPAEERPQRSPTRHEVMTLAACTYQLADSLTSPGSETRTEAAAAARSLVDACTDVLLSHLCEGRTPPMEAACILADAKLILWQAEASDPALLKEARSIVRRVQSTFAAALEGDTATQEHVTSLEARIVQAEAELLARQSEVAIVAADAFQHGRRRASWRLEQAETYLTAGLVGSAETCLHDAADDLFQALAVRERRVRVGEAGMQLALLTVRSEQLDALGELRFVLLRALDLSFRGGDVATEVEVATLLVDVADEGVELMERAIDMPEGLTATVVRPAMFLARVEDRLRLARAWMGHGDLPALERARRVLAAAEQLLIDLDLATRDDALAFTEGDAVADLRRQWAAAGELLKQVQGRDSGSLQETLEDIGQADAPLPPPDSSPYDLLLAAHRFGAHAAIALNANRLDDALRLVRRGLVCALAASPFNRLVPRLLQLAAYVFERRPAGSQLDEIMLDRASWYLALQAAADALDAARLLTRGDQARIGLGDDSFSRYLVEQAVKGFAFGTRTPSYAIASVDRFRARAIEQALQEAASAPTGHMPPISVPPDLASYGDDRSAFIAAATYVTEQAKGLRMARGVCPPLDSEAIAAWAQQRQTALIWIQQVGSRVALLLMGSDGQSISIWSPMSMRHWCSAAEGLLQTPDHVQLQRQLWNALFEPLQPHLPDGSHVTIVPPVDGPLVPFGLLQDATERFAVDRFVISLAPSLATLRTLDNRGRWQRSRPRRAYILGDPTLEKDCRNDLLGARAEALSVQARLLSAGMPQEAITLRLGGAAVLDSYRVEAAHCDLLHLACHAEIVARDAGETRVLRLAGSLDSALQTSEVPDVPLADALVVLSACSSGQGRATTDGVIGLSREYLRAGARAVVVSLWPVDDRVAPVFFDHFYAGLLDRTNRLDAAHALAEAARRTRDDLKAQRLEDDSGPLPLDAYFWAPFTIVGDAQVVIFGTGRDGVSSLTDGETKL